MRTHGWNGDPPASDQAAVARIVSATRACIDDRGAETSITDVARVLGVTRQTVYRYFSSTEELLTVVAVDAADEFMDRLAAHAVGITDPGAAVVEALAYTFERLPAEPYLGAILLSGRVSTFARGATSASAMGFGRSLVGRFDVDWARQGVTGEALDELVEWMLRVFQSLVLDPGRPPRAGDALRDYLGRWLAPAVMAMVAVPEAADR